MSEVMVKVDGFASTSEKTISGTEIFTTGTAGVGSTPSSLLQDMTSRTDKNKMWWIIFFMRNLNKNIHIK
ncbi:MAG: hypothetical protein BGO34_07430 [Bacteroidia bacterium 44-10]|nr:MAG: hypothetical protein BGO34_07430 [Bacteroidia bacterium 44-10]